MAIKKYPLDKPFLIIITSILVFGLLSFSSAALGVLARHEVKFYMVLSNQLIYALLGGAMALAVGLFFHYTVFRRYSLYIYIATLILTLLVFAPGIGFEHGGAHRWIHIFGFSLQPSELLKYGTILFLATWIATYKKDIKTLEYGLIPFAIITGIPTLILLMQPDTGTAAVLLAGCFAMYFASGASWKHVGIVCAAAILGLILLMTIRPYVKDRIMTFINPSRDSLGSSYQIQQSLIAIGSGGLFGRGYGQSVQKFNFLPEPIGDSIFAVIGEELGFLGAGLIIVLFLALGVRGAKLALLSRDSFGMNVALGISILILTQCFMNVAAMLGVIPLTGVPLPMVSHGGTALLVTLFGVGIILNISRYRTQN
jgi:cell division protein FtsW